MNRSFNHWGHCDDCHFEGLLRYKHIDDENYSDDSALGYMLLQTCPGCGSSDNMLIPTELYAEMIDLVTAQQQSADEPNTPQSS